MKSELLMAINQLAAEKNLPREVVLHTAEQALATALKKDNLALTQLFTVRIDSGSGEVRVFLQKEVVDEVSDPRSQVAVEEARRFRPQAVVGDSVEVPVALPESAGRIAAQTAKQVLLQRLKEAEHNAIFEEFHAREGDVLVGIVQRIEPKQIILDLGRGEAVLPQTEQVRTERYRPGQRLRVYLVEVQRGARGTQLVVSRSHKNLLRRLLELEVPEIHQGVVEIKSIAREPGSRSKVAVLAHQEGVDPVGCCVGQRGIRIQGIVRELGGERIDVVVWDPNPAVLIANALSPAQVLSVQVREAEKTAEVVVPDKQLSLAIGKEGQNARLAAKLTGWRIDIKSASVSEAEKPVEAAPEVLEVVTAEVSQAIAEPLVAALPEVEAAVEEEITAEVPIEVEAVEEVAAEEPVAEAAGEEAVKVVESISFEELFAPKVTVEKSALRFAEEIPELRRGGRGRGKKDEERRGKKAKRRDVGLAQPEVEEE